MRNPFDADNILLKSAVRCGIIPGRGREPKHDIGGVRMTKDEKKFILFLLGIAEKQGKAGRLYFPDNEYKVFPGYDLLLKGMIKRGFLEWKGDIADGIEVTPFAITILREQL